MRLRERERERDASRRLYRYRLHQWLYFSGYQNQCRWEQPNHKAWPVECHIVCRDRPGLIYSYRITFYFDFFYFSFFFLWHRSKLILSLHATTGSSRVVIVKWHKYLIVVVLRACTILIPCLGLLCGYRYQWSSSWLLPFQNLLVCEGSLDYNGIHLIWIKRAYEQTEVNPTPWYKHWQKAGLVRIYTILEN
jgi:hypothetical protein